MPNVGAMQARETLLCELQARIDAKRAALKSLREHVEDVRSRVLSASRALAAVGGDAAESAPRGGGSGQPAGQQQQQPPPQNGGQAVAAPMEEG